MRETVKVHRARSASCKTQRNLFLFFLFYLPRLYRPNNIHINIVPLIQIIHPVSVSLIYISFSHIRLNSFEILLGIASSQHPTHNGIKCGLLPTKKPVPFLKNSPNSMYSLVNPVDTMGHVYMILWLCIHVS